LIMIIMSIEPRVTGALTSIIIKPKPDRSMTSRTKSRKHLLQSGTIVHPPLQIIPQETKWERPPQMWMGLYGSAMLIPILNERQGVFKIPVGWWYFRSFQYQIGCGDQHTMRIPIKWY
jgi:hypothetical protein